MFKRLTINTLKKQNLINNHRLLSSESKKPAGGNSDFAKVWLSPKEAWPIFIVVGGALCLSVYKIYHDAMGPTPHFNKADRSKLDFIENNRDAKAIEQWSKSALHSGPSFVQERKEAILQQKKD